MRAVDTDLLVRLIARDDARQVKVAEEFVSKGAWVSLLVLAETTWVLDSVYDRSAADIATTIEMLLNHVSLSVQDSEVAEAALQRFRDKPAPWGSLTAWSWRLHEKPVISRSARSIDGLVAWTGHRSSSGP
jgi:predicted nucleic-acid-binding protein